MKKAATFFLCVAKGFRMKQPGILYQLKKGGISHVRHENLEDLG
jgi:hypothetical protein